MKEKTSTKKVAKPAKKVAVKKVAPVLGADDIAFEKWIEKNQDKAKGKELLKLAYKAGVVRGKALAREAAKKAAQAK